MPHRTKSWPRALAAGAALSITLWGAASSAQCQGYDEDGQNGDHLAIGLGAAYTPAYQGADKYRTLPIPVLDLQWGRLFANLENGVGVNVIDNDRVTAGASITVVPGYRAKDAPEGIGKLKLGAGGRAYVSLKARGVVATLGATKGVSGGNKGLVADTTLSYPIGVSSRLTLIPSIRATWADKDYTDRYFGVSAAQSLASGLPEFRPGSGLKDASALLSVNYRLTDRLNLSASAGATTLLGKAKDSPIVFHKTQPLGFVSLSYRFGL
jgi:outer membrane protein